MKNVTSDVVATVGTNYALTYSGARITGGSHKEGIDAANNSIGPSVAAGVISGVSKTIYPHRFGRGNKNNDDNNYDPYQDSYYGDKMPELNFQESDHQLDLNLLPKPKINPIPYEIRPQFPNGSFQLINDRWIWVPSY